MWQFFFASWRSGFRNRVFLGVLFLGVALVGVAYLSAAFSPRQPRTVALDVGLSGLRVSLALFCITLVQDLVGRDIERRSVILSLSYPVARASYLLGRYLGVLALTGVAALLLGLVLWIAVLGATTYDQQFPVALGWPFWITLVGAWLDAAVIASFSLLVASLSTVTLLPLVLGGLFAITARSIGAVFDFLQRGAEGQPDLATTYGPALHLSRWLLPDLSRLDWRAWPMYGVAPDGHTLLLGVALALAYTGLMLALAAYALSNRQFA